MTLRTRPFSTVFDRITGRSGTFHYMIGDRLKVKEPGSGKWFSIPADRAESVPSYSTVTTRRRVLRRLQEAANA